MGFYSDYIFPKFFDRVVQHKAFDERRAEVLKSATGRILEIGIGTGLNLDLYPSHVNEIFAIDPNPGMETQLRQKLNGHRLKVSFTRTGAESLPYPDNYFDTVISTLTLCSIRDLQKSLQEIQRVLSAQGKFIFLDHGLSRDLHVIRIQKLLNPIQNVIGCGCSLTVDVEKVLLGEGFRLEQLKCYYLPKAAKFIGHVYEGVASPAPLSRINSSF